MNKHASESNERRVVLCARTSFACALYDNRIVYALGTHTHAYIKCATTQSSFLALGTVQCLICRSQFDLAVSDCSAISITSIDNRVTHVFAGYSICQSDYSVSSSKSTCVDLQLEIRVTVLFRTLVKINTYPCIQLEAHRTSSTFELKAIA